MPATEHAFSEPAPAGLYLDTDILISCLVESQPDHERCRAFLDRLAQEGATAVYVSSLTWLELAHVVCKQGFRDQIPDAMQQQYQLDRWQERAIRERYLGSLLEGFDQLLSAFNWGEVPIVSALRREALGYMMAYRRDPHDAAHVAAARSIGVADLASLDRAYRRVDDLELWNDRIYG